ncbi:hypothetical protein AMECASPLE_021997, partial [Ameca splendens]
CDVITTPSGPGSCSLVRPSHLSLGLFHHLIRAYLHFSRLSSIGSLICTYRENHCGRLTTFMFQSGSVNFLVKPTS